jgi:hypothetical protein
MLEGCVYVCINEELWPFQRQSETLVDFSEEINESVAILELF